MCLMFVNRSCTTFIKLLCCFGIGQHENIYTACLLNTYGLPFLAENSAFDEKNWYLMIKPF